MSDSASALDPNERLIKGPDIDADLGIGGAGRTRRKMVKDGRLPPPAGYIGGRAVWRLTDYLAARERLLASGRPHPGPGKQLEAA